MQLREIEKQHGKPKTVELNYWLNEQDYLERSTDAHNGIAGDWRMANANTRAVYTALTAQGYEVVFVPSVDNLPTV